MIKANHHIKHKTFDKSEETECRVAYSNYASAQEYGFTWGKTRSRFFFMR